MTMSTAPRARRSRSRAGFRVLRPLVVAVALPVLAWAALMLHVRGEPVGAPPAGAELERLIRSLADGAPTVSSQHDLRELGLVTAGLVASAGTRPGPFHVLFLPELDALERFHHLMHGPFTGIRRMYTDIWIHSLTTYGREETTWGWHPQDPVRVRPTIKLPVLLFLLDRLGRGKTAFDEYTGAVAEAFRGMAMHTLSGRAALWLRLIAHCRAHPDLGRFVRAQLELEDPRWTDGAELQMWMALQDDPRPATLEALAVGRPVPPAGGRSAAGGAGGVHEVSAFTPAVSFSRLLASAGPGMLGP